MSVSFRLSKYLIQFTLAYLVLKINLCQSQFIDSQYFTPALLIINGPQPDQNIDGIVDALLLTVIHRNPILYPLTDLIIWFHSRPKLTVFLRSDWQW